MRQHPISRSVFLLVLAPSILASGPGPTAVGAQALPRDTADPAALVLSGGSARGLAHIGVLMRLHELGYGPDLVVGTSMGAVVGALYAAGHAPQEILDLTLAIDWTEMFDPTAAALGPARELRLPMATFSLDLTGGRVSRGLFGEWRINRALVALLFDANARAAGDFDRLARRYRAIAADLETGESVVLASGDLARAVRASMSYPGFFSPVHWDERLLVDGGIADNLPTAVARRLGASHVVAVDVSRPRDEVSQDPLAVAGRALSLMQQNLRGDTLPPDVLVVPSVAPLGIGPAFPDDPEPVIEVGLEAAIRDLPAASELPTARQRPGAPPPRTFSALHIEAPDSALASLARQAFSRVAPGPYDPAAVLAVVDRLYSTGLFEGIWPRVSRADSLEEGSTLVVLLDAAARLSISGGAGFENDRGGRGWAALDRYTSLARRPASLRAAVSTDGLERFGSLSARVQTTARPSIAWSMGAHVMERSVRTFEEDIRSTIEVIRSGGWLGIEMPHILRERALTVGGLAEWVDPEDAPGGWSWGPRLRLTSTPTPGSPVGVPLVLAGEARWGDRVYQRVDAAASRRFGGGVVQLAALADLRVVAGDAPIDVQPALGNQHAVPGLRWGERRGSARAVVGLDVAVPAPLAGFAHLRVRTGAVADDPAAWEGARWITGARIGGTWNTPFGVLEAGYGHATVGDGRFELSAGRQF